MDSEPHQTLAEWVQAELAACEAEQAACEALAKAKADEAAAANASASRLDPAPTTPPQEDVVNLDTCHVNITTVSYFIVEAGSETLNADRISISR